MVWDTEPLNRAPRGGCVTGCLVCTAAARWRKQLVQPNHPSPFRIDNVVAKFQIIATFSLSSWFLIQPYYCHKWLIFNSRAKWINIIINEIWFCWYLKMIFQSYYCHEWAMTFWFYSCGKWINKKVMENTKDRLSGAASNPFELTKRKTQSNWESTSLWKLDFLPRKS